MSAFVVSKRHIDALVTAALKVSPRPFYWYHDGQSCYADAATAGRVGAMLWAENLRSVNHRYAEDELEEPYEYERYALRLAPVDVLKALDCYEYQSCEHDGWRTSEAHAFVEQLRGVTIAALPGYDRAPWGID